jgi:hypothetical protein
MAAIPMVRRGRSCDDSTTYLFISQRIFAGHVHPLSHDDSASVVSENWLDVHGSLPERTPPSRKRTNAVGIAKVPCVLRRFANTRDRAYRLALALCRSDYDL